MGPRALSARAAGTWLIVAAGLFWLSWLLMPGVGVTDARQILEGVGRQRSRVGTSAVLQLVSAACYAPALVGLVVQPGLSGPGVRWSATLLLVGAMGSAADAVFHVVALFMTHPDLGREGLVPLMALVQGPGLAFIVPLIASFFLGGLGLAVALARGGVVSGWNPGLYALGVAVATAAALAPPGAARALGLVFLGLVAGSQAWIGAAIRRQSGRGTA